MANLPQVGAVVEIQNLPGFKSAVDQVNGGLRDISKASDDVAKGSLDMSKVLSVAANVGMAAVTAAAAVAVAGIIGLTIALADCINTAMVAQDVQTQLNTVLDSTGGIAGITADELAKYAEAMMNVTRFDDEAVMSAETVILQFTKIGRDVFPQALEAAADLATRLGIDLPQAAQMVARGIGDPEQGIWRLNMAFRLFDDTQVKVIENLAKTGHVAEAQQIVLKALAEKLGGAAEAAGSTATGQWTIFQNKLDNIKEAIGTPFLTVLGNLMSVLGPPMLAALSNLAPVAERLAAVFGIFFNRLAAGNVATKLIPALASAFGKLFGAEPDFSWIIHLADVINNLAVPLADIINMLAGGNVLGALGVLTGGNQDAALFFAGIATAITVAGDAIKAFVDAIVTTVGPTLQGIFDQLTGILADFGLNWGDVWNAIKTALIIVAAAIGAILAALLGVIVGIVSGISSAVEQIVIAWRNVLPHIQGVVEGIMKVLIGLWQFFAKLFEGDFPGACRALEVAWEGVKQFFTETALAIWEGLKGTFNMITGFIKGFVDGIVTFFQNLYNNLVGHSIVDNLVNGILGQFRLLITQGPALFQQFTDGVFQVASNLLNNITDLFANIGSGIGTALAGGTPPAGGAAPTGGAPAPGPAGGAVPAAPGGGTLETLLLQITTLRSAFTALMDMVTIGLTTFVSTITISFATLLETAITPFVAAMQAVSTWVLIGSTEFANLAKSITAMTATFSAFKMQAVLDIMDLVAQAQAQFVLFGIYLEENKGNWAKSWLDFVVAMEVQTSTAVNLIIGEFQRLASNVGGSALALTTAWGASMTGIMLQVAGQLSPALLAGGGAFKGLAQAAKEAANDVAAACAEVCDAVTAANNCVTASPELVLQHPFEGFMDFLRQATPQAERLIGQMVNPLANVATAAGAITSDMGVLARASNVAGGSNITNNYEYTLGPVYQQPQSPVSMMDDLVLMNLLAS